MLCVLPLFMRCFRGVSELAAAAAAETITVYRGTAGAFLSLDFYPLGGGVGVLIPLPGQSKNAFAGRFS